LAVALFLDLDYFFNILQNIFEIFLFFCFFDLGRFLERFLEKGAGSFGEKVAKHRLQSGAQGTGKSKSLFLILNAHPAGLGPPEPCLYPPELQFEFVRSYFGCTEREFWEKGGKT